MFRALRRHVKTLVGGGSGGTGETCTGEIGTDGAGTSAISRRSERTYRRVGIGC